jgi:hypothetical protein
VWTPLTLEKERGYSHEFVQYFTSGYYAVTFFGSLASGWFTMQLAQRGWNVHRARMHVFLGCSVLSMLTVPAAFLPNGPLLLGTMLLIAFGSLGLFPLYYSLNQELSAKNQGKVGGIFSFCSWILLSQLNPAIGRLVNADPSLRPYIFAAVGLGPIVAFAALALFWGKRPVLDTEPA